MRKKILLLDHYTKIGCEALPVQLARMKERGITMMQVLNCLSKGEFLEVAYSHDYGGGYIASLRRMVAGERIKVVVSLKLNKKLLVITAISLKY